MCLWGTWHVCREEAFNDGYLFDFSFFVNNVFAYNWIEFFDLHFFGHCPFVFGGGIEVSGSFSGNQFNFIAHFLSP
jgi:hypothetical protein